MTIAPMTQGTRADGARVGAAIGIAALAIGLPSGEGWWLAAAIPAGAIAGAWAGPRVAVQAPIPARLVVAVAAISTVVGDAAISAGLALTSASIRDGGPPGVLGAWIGLTVLGLLSIGWLALFVLMPVSAAAVAILRSRAGRGGASPSGSSWAAWLAGVVPGVASGVLSLLFPIVGYEIALLLVVGALLSRWSMAALGGALLGAGTAWVLLIVNGALSCHPGDCVSPDLGPWLAVGGGLVATGSALTVASKPAAENRARQVP